MLAVAALAVLQLPVAATPEEGPLVNLRGVRLSVRGFEARVGSIVTREVLPDPDKQFTGFTRTENEAMAASLRKTAEAILVADGIEVLPWDVGSGLEPELEVDVSWIIDRPHDRFALRVNVRLLEPAMRYRDRRRVWVPVWNVIGVGFATHDTFRSTVEGFVQNYMREFAENVRRARRTG